MKLESQQVAIAFDGKKFLTEAECKAYEEENWLAQFAGLTPAQVEAAWALVDGDLADAFVRLGQRLSRKRLDAGDRRRAFTPRNGKTQADADAEARERAEQDRAESENEAA